MLRIKSLSKSNQKPLNLPWEFDEKMREMESGSGSGVWGVENGSVCKTKPLISHINTHSFPFCLTLS